MSRTRKILVTGASSGIGLATAQYLMSRDYSVVCTSRSAGALREVLGDVGPRLEIREFDLAETESMADWAKSVIASSGPLNGFVHCAGIQK